MSRTLLSPVASSCPRVHGIWGSGMALEAFSCFLETEELSDSNSSFSRRLGEGGVDGGNWDLFFFFSLPFLLFGGKGLTPPLM